MTGRDMCEAIARYIKDTTGKEVDPEKDIWQMSSSGELWPVFELYEEAKAAGYGVEES